jgi:hypothetical protein
MSKVAAVTRARLIPPCEASRDVTGAWLPPGREQGAGLWQDGKPQSAALRLASA